MVFSFAPVVLIYIVLLSIHVFPGVKSGFGAVTQSGYSPSLPQRPVSTRFCPLRQMTGWTLKQGQWNKQKEERLD